MLNGQLASAAGRSSLGPSTPTPSMSSRVTDFVEKNKRALLLGVGASVLVAGSAVGYLYYTRPGAATGGRKGDRGSSSNDNQALGDEGETAGKKKSKKKKSKKGAAGITSAAASGSGSGTGTGTGSLGAATTTTTSEQVQSDSEGSSDGPSRP